MRRFVEARKWDELAELVRNSNEQASLGEMLRLLHRPKLSKLPDKDRGVHDIFFYKDEEIISLLSGYSPTLRVNVAPFPSKENDPSVGEAPIESKDIAMDPLLSSIDIGPRHGAGVDSAGGVIERIAVFKVHDFPTQEFVAARTIQAAYRKATRCKSRKMQSGPQATREAFFNSCALIARGMNWPTPYYRLLFLGPLTHALFTADWIYQFAHSSKQKAKRQLNDLKDNRSIEDARARQTECASRAQFYWVITPTLSRSQPALQEIARTSKSFGPKS